MKKIVSLILALSLIFTCTLTFAHPFTDISSHWAEGEISSAYEDGIVEGEGTGVFRPDDNISRAEFIKIVSATVAKRFELEIPKADSSVHWATNYYSFASTNFVMPIVSLNYNNISPAVMNNENFDIPITRWEMAYILNSALVNIYGAYQDYTKEIADIEKITATYDEVIVDSIRSLVEMEVIKGDENGNFNPADNGTRAEAIALFARSVKIMELYEEYYKALEEQQNAPLETSITYDKIPTGHPKVEFKLSDGRKFEITLYPEFAPQTCANFVELVKDGFYDGLTFHRIVEGFVAQGGDPNGDGTGGAANTIVGEFSSNGFDKNTLKHEKGVVSMARSQNPNSASSQFFICYDTADFLDGNYAAFGKVTSGMNVIESFTKVELLQNDLGELAKPKTPIKIISAKLK